MVEAAIITPLLLLVTFSVLDFGLLFFVNLALENGVSQASRYAVTGNLMDDPANPGTKLGRQDSIKLAMRLATPTLTIDDSAFTFTYLPPGGTTWLGGTGGPDDIAKVQVDYTWNLLNPLMWPFVPSHQMNLRVDSTMKNESKFE